jgi:Tol biopolymer transport system component
MLIRHLPFLVALGATLSQPALSAEAAWDITNTGQPYRDVSFTTTEGTWMSVDVSPDGKTLVFDLLGDIYSLPAGGGDAKLIQGGPAMQRTPSFSRDGRHLVYISDTSGAENAWICDPDGSNARQVTHETQNLIMAAVWGPDNDTVITEFIDGRYPRRFASDIRAFDVAGGSRVIVPTPDNKRDVA